MNKILAYHSIGSPLAGEVGSELYCIPVENFRAQMEYLRNTQYTIHNTQITFDDGDITNYTHAFPVLKELGLTAYFFIIGGRIGSPGYMNWEQIKELRDAGMTIGSHGITHRILTGLTDSEIDYELRESKRILEENLNTTIEHLSIPRGFYDERIIQKADEIGYKTIFTSKERVAVKADWDMDKFERMLFAKPSLDDKVMDFIKESSKRILGPKNYDILRTKILTRGL
ncbi:MAG: polysaccharide deacetylase family protein [Candidatus Omnitrophica bacterium]|nr:polysaccharide deacetylase family protein [Candidatus Omnitrophota bacterium]